IVLREKQVQLSLEYQGFEITTFEVGIPESEKLAFPILYHDKMLGNFLLIAVGLFLNYASQLGLSRIAVLLIDLFFIYPFLKILDEVNSVNLTGTSQFLVQLANIWSEVLASEVLINNQHENSALHVLHLLLNLPIVISTFKCVVVISVEAAVEIWSYIVVHNDEPDYMGKRLIRYM
ncbi:hypothetical protein ACJX0J_016708, partial [Zea mays]